MLLQVLQVSADRHLNAGDGWLYGFKANFSFLKMLDSCIAVSNANR